MICTYPRDNAKERYGLVVYLHAGGFTSGDKSDDAEMLSWLCSKGYVACGINYTLRTDANDASVFSQSNEIKAAIPKVIEAAEAEGYPVDRLAIGGRLRRTYPCHAVCLSGRSGIPGACCPDVWSGRPPFLLPRGGLEQLRV